MEAICFLPSSNSACARSASACAWSAVALAWPRAMFAAFRWGRLGHLGDRERRYGRQRRESEADPASLLGKCLH